MYAEGLPSHIVGLLVRPGLFYVTFKRDLFNFFRIQTFFNKLKVYFCFDKREIVTHGGCPSIAPCLKNNDQRLLKRPNSIAFKEWVDTRISAYLKSTH